MLFYCYFIISLKNVTNITFFYTLSFTCFIISIIQIDDQIRQGAEMHLRNAEESQFAPFLIALCEEFAIEDREMQGRRLAGLYLKNMVSAQDINIKASKKKRWAECDAETKNQARTAFLQALASPQSVIAHTAAQVVAAFGCMDIELNESSELIQTLSSYVTESEVPTPTKMSALECIGYMCEGLYAQEIEVDEESTNAALNAIMVGVAHPDNEIKHKALIALYNTLPFTSDNVEKEEERDAIMECILKMATEVNVEATVRKSAYDCLNLFAEMYYKYLPKYIEHFAQVTQYSICNDDEEVAFKAIEFWTTVAESELEAEYREESHRIMHAVNDGLLPLMLDTLTKQKEDLEDEEYTMADYGAIFLERHTLCVKEVVLPLVLQYISENLGKADWREKDAAITAFGFIMDGPDPNEIQEHVGKALPLLIRLAGDTSQHVVLSSLWCIARICEFHPGAIANLDESSQDHLVAAFLRPLQASSGAVVEKACYAILKFAEIAELMQTADDQSNHLTRYFQDILSQLLTATNRPDFNDVSSRSAVYSCYEAASAVVLNSAKGQRELVQAILDEAVKRLAIALDEQQEPDRQRRIALHGFLSPLIGNCVQKIDKQILMSQSIENTCITDVIVRQLIEVMKVEDGATADALCCITQVATNLEDDFKVYMDAIKPDILKPLQEKTDASACVMAVALIGDYCRILGDEILSNFEFADLVVGQYLEILGNDNVDKSVKPHVIACFGDIALAINDQFKRYSEHVLPILSTASAMQLSEDDDEDLDDFVLSLRENILSAYSSILHALIQGDMSGIDDVRPFLDGIVRYAGEWCSKTDTNKWNDDILKNAIGLMGDLASTFAKKGYSQLIYKTLSESPGIVQMMQEYANAEDESIKEVMNYAQTEIQKCAPNRVV